MALSDLQPVRRNEEGIAAVLGVLKQRFGERFQTGQSVREQHAHTTTYIPNQPPDGVVWPESTEEVQEVVRACAAHRVPVIAFGTGSSLEGHVNAPGGGISLDTGRMARVVEVNADDLDCTVEPGVTREDLNRYLRDISGSRVTAKDFRTLHASAMAAEALAKLEPGQSQSSRKRQVAGVAKTVAAFLRNTPAITRKSYIAPCLFSMFEKATLADLWAAAAAQRHDGLRAREARLAAVLAAAG